MNIANFLSAEIADCKQRNISVVLSPTQTIKCGVFDTTGWFDEESLQVAIDRPVQEWLATFVHESCHKDQFVEGEPWQAVKLGEHDCCDILDMWLEKIIELSPERLAEVVGKVQALELDCERRAASKIKQYGLPLDLDLYIKKANAYVWFHRTLPVTRKWVVAPYNNPLLLDMMPTHFDNDYNALPVGFLSIIEAAT